MTAQGRDRGIGDFNGDGYPDLAVGVPGANGGFGAVIVMYGSSSGLSTAGSQYWTLNTSGLPEPRAAPGDQFGASLAIGRYSGGKYSDLAIGVPGRSGVVVLYGSPVGLGTAGSQWLPAIGPLGASSLASGDLNRDGLSDLAIGDPYANSTRPGAGVVEVHYGSPSGLTSVARGTAQRFSEATPVFWGLRPGVADGFGTALAIGDFNGDGVGDLAVGDPGASFGAGTAIVLYGSRKGLTTEGSQELVGFGLDAFSGSAVAAGDFNGDGIDDLAVGEPGTETAVGDAGAVEVHYGSREGLGRTRVGMAQFLSEVSPGMPGPPTAYEDRFGAALTTADFNGDGVDDLAVSVPGKSGVFAMYGSPRGLTTRSAQFVAGVGPQATSNLSETGVAIAAADFKRTGDADLAVGEPFATASNAGGGVLEVHSGSSVGLADVAKGTAPLFAETTPGMPVHSPGAQDNFGFAVAARG